MSLQGSKTTSSYIEWNAVQSLVQRLERDGDGKFSLLIAVGAFTGLRIGDILTLKWNNLLGQDTLQIVEQKTRKERKITINTQLSEIVTRIFKTQHGINRDSLIFLNRWGKVAISRQFVNHKLKQIATKYKITKDSTTIKSHSLRKSFGRRVFENNDNSERALILLSDILNHSSIKTTKIYLGIREREIQDVYANL